MTKNNTLLPSIFLGLKPPVSSVDYTLSTQDLGRALYERIAIAGAIS